MLEARWFIVKTFQGVNLIDTQIHKEYDKQGRYLVNQEDVGIHEIIFQTNDYMDLIETYVNMRLKPLEKRIRELEDNL